MVQNGVAPVQFLRVGDVPRNISSHRRHLPETTELLLVDAKVTQLLFMSRRQTPTPGTARRRLRYRGREERVDRERCLRSTSPVQRLGQLAQEGGAVAAPGAAVHAGERRRARARRAARGASAAVRGVRVVVHRAAEGLARPEDVGLGQRGESAAALGEEIAAEQASACAPRRGSRTPRRAAGGGCRARSPAASPARGSRRRPAPAVAGRRGRRSRPWPRRGRRGASTAAPRPATRSASRTRRPRRARSRSSAAARPAARAATASRTSGNSRRGPVWKSSGSSSTTRYWLNVKPPGTTSGGSGMLIR